MKKIIMISAAAMLCLLFNSTVSTAQKNEVTAPHMPMDKQTGMVTYTEEVTTQGIKVQLYNRALAWFYSYYKNPTDVVKEKDEANGKVTGKHRFKIFNEDKKGFRTDAGLVQYTITVTTQDGKYNIVISEINWKQPSYYGIEKWMDKSSKLYSKTFDFYLLQTNEQIRDVIKSLKSHMATVSK